MGAEMTGGLGRDMCGGVGGIELAENMGIREMFEAEMAIPVFDRAAAEVSVEIGVRLARLKRILAIVEADIFTVSLALPCMMLGNMLLPFMGSDGVPPVVVSLFLAAFYLGMRFIMNPDRSMRVRKRINLAQTGLEHVLAPDFGRHLYQYILVRRESFRDEGLNAMRDTLGAHTRLGGAAGEVLRRSASRFFARGLQGLFRECNRIAASESGYYCDGGWHSFGVE